MVDTDAHWLESMVVLTDYVRQLAGDEMAYVDRVAIDLVGSDGQDLLPRIHNNLANVEPRLRSVDAWYACHASTLSPIRVGRIASLLAS